MVSGISKLGAAFNQGYGECLEMPISDFITLNAEANELNSK